VGGNVVGRGRREDSSFGKPIEETRNWETSSDERTRACKTRKRKSQEEEETQQITSTVSRGGTEGTSHET